MTLVIVAYDSRHGSTGEVAQTVADTLRGIGLDVHVERVDQLDGLAEADAVVVGAPVYMGRWTKAARALLREHHEELASRPVAVFATGPLHEDEREFAQARSCVEKALAATPDVKPCAVQVFGGSLDPASHRFPFNRMAAADVRDWETIRAWARSLPETLGVA